MMPGPATLLEKPSRAGARETLLYLYGVVRAEKAGLTRDLSQAGLLPGNAVRLIPFDGLVALVSDVPKADFTEPALAERLQDQTWVRAQVLDHHRVLASLPAVPLLPFKFCTLFTDEAALLRALKRYRADLHTAFGVVEGAREWGVKLSVDYKALCAHLTASAPHLAQIARRVATVGSGTAFFLRRKLETLAREAAIESAGDRAGAVHKALDATVRASKVQAVPADASRTASDNGGGRELLSNVAYLVPLDAEERFKQAIATLARRHMSAGLSFDVVGPLPPYSFAMIAADGVSSPNAGGPAAGGASA